MDYSLHRATMVDLPLLLSIDQRSCDREGFDWQGAKAKREALIRSFLEESQNFSFVAQTANRSVGAIMVRTSNPSEPTVTENTWKLLIPIIGSSMRFAEIFDLWVEPEFRRQGIARELKSTLEAECKSRGIEWIFTFQHPENAEAIHMNEALGYEHIGSHAIYDAISRVCFLKRVANA